MALEWMKMRLSLWDDPRVLAIAERTSGGEAAVIGGLYWLWATGDAHSVDGFLPGLTLSALDRRVGIKDFGSALVTVDWLEVVEGGLKIPRFDTHNGESAKRRAMEAQRKAASRKRGGKKEQQDEAPEPDEAETLPAESVPPCPAQEIADAFNAAFMKQDRMTDKRRAAARARWRDPAWRAEWREALSRAAQRPFCNGQNDRGWVASLEWFLRPETVTKLMEGAYAGSTNNRGTSTAARREQDNADAFDLFERAATSAQRSESRTSGTIASRG